MLKSIERIYVWMATATKRRKVNVDVQIIIKNSEENFINCTESAITISMACCRCCCYRPWFNLGFNSFSDELSTTLVWASFSATTHVQTKYTLSKCQICQNKGITHQSSLSWARSTLSTRIVSLTSSHFSFYDFIFMRFEQQQMKVFDSIEKIKQKWERKQQQQSSC